jgi:hypothetical protein
VDLIEWRSPQEAQQIRPEHAGDVDRRQFRLEVRQPKLWCAVRRRNAVARAFTGAPTDR